MTSVAVAAVLPHLMKHLIAQERPDRRRSMVQGMAFLAPAGLTTPFLRGTRCMSGHRVGDLRRRSPCGAFGLDNRRVGGRHTNCPARALDD